MARQRRVQAAAPSLDGFHRYFDLEDCLMFVAHELGRLGAREEDLLPHQQRMLGDLTSALDEDALASMFEYWLYDVPALIERNRGDWRPAKPRIDVDVEITSKGNFKAEWFPRDANRWGNYRRQAESDWLNWHRFENRSGGFDSRPSNELFFIHDVEDAIYSLKERERYSPFQILDHVFLAACAAVVTKLYARLEPHFDVRMRSDVFVEWVEPEDRWSDEGYRIASWTIDDPQARKDAEELAELESLSERHGYTEQDLLNAWRDLLHAPKARTGPPPSIHTLPDRITKALKSEGRAATLGNVRRAMTLMRKHRAKTVSEVEGEPATPGVVIAADFGERHEQGPVQ